MSAIYDGKWSVPSFNMCTTRARKGPQLIFVVATSHASPHLDIAKITGNAKPQYLFVLYVKYLDTELKKRLSYNTQQKPFTR